MNVSLIITQVNLLEIISGEKGEEYRDMTPANIAKFCDKDGDGNLSFKPIKSLTLYAGYHKDRKFATVEVTGMTIEAYLDDDDKETDEEYFVFVLGEIIDTNVIS